MECEIIAKIADVRECLTAAIEHDLAITNKTTAP